MPAGTRSTSSSTPATSKKSGEPTIMDLNTIKRLISESIQEMLPKLIENTFSKLVNKLESLTTENEQLRSRIEKLEDLQYSGELEVCGIPEKEGCDLNIVSKTILSKLQVDDQNVRDGFVKAYRLPPPKDSTSNQP